ncbi:MAG: hypothetical protein AABZ55_00490 [Bdellovibrionota bacterium]
MKKKTIAFLGLSAVLTLAFVSLPSCLNLFDPVDNPHNDTQYISAARAAFDKGDFTEAARLYGKLSTASDSIRISETVFTTLDSLGAGMKAYIVAIGKQGADAGGLITSLAGAISANGNTGTTNRVTLFNAYKSAFTISTADSGIRGMARFLAAMAYTASIFAEDAGVAGTYSANDLTSNGVTCKAAGVGCAGSASCDSAGVVMNISGVIGGTELNTFSVAAVTAETNRLDLIHHGLFTADNALSEMSAAGGGVGGSTAGLFAALNPLTGSVRCYRQALLNFNLGSN